MFALQFRICLQIPSDPFNGSILVLFRDVLIGGHLQSTALYCTALQQQNTSLLLYTAKYCPFVS